VTCAPLNYSKNKNHYFYFKNLTRKNRALLLRKRPIMINDTEGGCHLLNLSNHLGILAIILCIDYQGQLKPKVTMSLQACLTPASSKNNRNMSVHLLLHKNLYNFGITYLKTALPQLKHTLS